MLKERYTDIPYSEASKIVEEVFDIYTNLKLMTNERQESLYSGQNFENEIVDTTRTNSVEDRVIRNLEKSTALHLFNKELRSQLNKLDDDEKEVINWLYYSKSKKTNEDIAEIMDYSVSTIKRRRESATKKLAFAFKHSDRLNKLKEEI